MAEPVEIRPGEIETITIGFTGQGQTGTGGDKKAKLLELEGSELYFAVQPPGVRPPPGQ